MNKPALIISLVAMALCACVTDSPLLVSKISALDSLPKDTCKATTLAGGGSLDLAGGGSYVLEIELLNDLDSTLDTMGGTQTLVTGMQRNTVILDQVTFTYSSVPTVAFSQEATPLAYPVPPNGKIQIRTGILNRKAIEKLMMELPPPAAGSTAPLETRDIRVKIVFSGSIVSGGRLSSVPISYPIHVFNSGFSCPKMGDTLGATGPCGNNGGQDGSRLCCASDITCAPVK